MQAPLYEPGQKVYLRESAAIGMIESVTISSVQSSQNGWVYTWQSAPDVPNAPQFSGDRRSFAGAGAVLYLSEGEIVDLCEAVRLAEANAQANLANIQRMRINFCPET